MQHITSRHAPRPSLLPFVLGALVGTILLTGGLFLAWLAFATPVVRDLTPAALQPDPFQAATGAAIWGLALVAPPCFAIVGALRLGRLAQSVVRRPSSGAVARAAGTLSNDYVAARGVRLPDGRVIRDVILGPFGLAVLSELPPAHATRRNGMVWEIRRPDGRWWPLENPLERTTRDGERVRRWAASDERDFIVKVYAAVVTTDTTLFRSPSCAVISPDQIPAWLASLPSSRSLNVDRRADLVKRLTAIS